LRLIGIGKGRRRRRRRRRQRETKGGRQAKEMKIEEEQ